MLGDFSKLLQTISEVKYYIYSSNVKKLKRSLEAVTRNRNQEPSTQPADLNQDRERCLDKAAIVG